MFFFSGGISGVIFVDAGINHKINDITGEIIDPVEIADISTTGIVKCSSNSSHNFQSNDIIIFDNLEGHNVEQFSKEWTINVLNTSTFELINFKYDSSFKLINGIAKHIKKKPLFINHQMFKDQLDDPKNIFSFDDQYSVDLIKTYLQLFNNKLINNMPFIWSEDNDTFMQENDIILKDQAKTLNIEIIPVISIMASITASEAIKLITNKHMPINQWFTWTDQVLLPITKPDNYDLNSAYEILYGTNYDNKLRESKLFIVGSGAIGCEHLKNMAFMNIF